MKCLKTLFSMIIIVSCHLEYGDGRRILRIKDFITDTNHKNVDYSQVFQKAWKGLCEGEGEGTGGSSLVINENEKYTIQPQLFEGPCVSSYIHIQIDGKIEAPKRPKQWGNKRTESWLMFKNVESLFINGSGVLDPHGETWWRSVRHSKRPRTLSFKQCTDIIYNGLTQYNSPKNHISVYGCTNATLSNLTLLAPEKSPNTDGIGISLSHNIRILDSSIQTGDDCIAITGERGGSSDINITRVACGPGHGISIGSLGKGDIDDTVENVIVRSCSFWGTQNGARIKTWHGNAVKVSDVTFRYIEGTSASKIAIKLDCDENQGCHNIVMEHIKLTSAKPGKKLSAYCKFADVKASFVNIHINCGLYPQLLPLFPSLPKII
ncbi:probable polygalacturonase At3g15720 isoform X3 [Brassica napus]|uniref:probable polygalacturonase At3g15720 isoform X3 n=1 Tax=Brassica napus TaxID=3708 RepID=UPI0020784E58|nr:probable polygalacturonase At3g15720 isoform X3 [Brassica napus]